MAPKPPEIVAVHCGVEGGQCGAEEGDSQPLEAGPGLEDVLTDEDAANKFIVVSY